MTVTSSKQLIIITKLVILHLSYNQSDVEEQVLQVVQ